MVTYHVSLNYRKATAWISSIKSNCSREKLPLTGRNLEQHQAQMGFPADGQLGNVKSFTPVLTDITTTNKLQLIWCKRQKACGNLTTNQWITTIIHWKEKCRIKSWIWTSYNMNIFGIQTLHSSGQRSQMLFLRPAGAVSTAWWSQPQVLSLIPTSTGAALSNPTFFPSL